jgi:DNA-directed RNA polymerase specialized sigma24 family protein
MPSTKEVGGDEALTYADLEEAPPCLSDSTALYVSYVGGTNMQQPTAAETHPSARTASTAERDRLLKDAYDWLYFVAAEWSLDDAEDLVQEALVRALEAWPHINAWKEEQQRAWLKKVALRTLIDARRKGDTAERNSFKIAALQTPEPPPAPVDISDDRVARTNRVQLFSHLPTEDRIILNVWAEQNGRHITVQDAASMLKLTVDEYTAAKRRIGRALKRHADALHLVLSDLVAEPTPLQCGGMCANAGGSDSDE